MPALVMAVAATASRLVEACDYTSLGPCLPLDSLSSVYRAQDSSGKVTRLSLKVTIPGQHASIQPPYPVLFFFNGFQVTYRSQIIPRSNKRSWISSLAILEAI